MMEVVSSTLKCVTLLLFLRLFLEQKSLPKIVSVKLHPAFQGREYASLISEWLFILDQCPVCLWVWQDIHSQAIDIHSTCATQLIVFILG